MSDQSSFPLFTTNITKHISSSFSWPSHPAAMQNNAPNNFQAYQFPQISNPPAQQSDLYTFAPAHNQNQQQQQLYYTAQTAHDQQGATDSSETAGPSQKKKVAAAKKHVVKEEPEEHTRADEPKKKRTKRSAGKACVYCRRRWVNVPM